LAECYKPSKRRSSPGRRWDVYVCDPMDHQGPAEEKKITILWAPLRE